HDAGRDFARRDHDVDGKRAVRSLWAGGDLHRTTAGQRDWRGALLRQWRAARVGGIDVGRGKFDGGGACRGDAHGFGSVGRRNSGGANRRGGGAGAHGDRTVNQVGNGLGGRVGGAPRRGHTDGRHTIGKRRE